VKALSSSLPMMFMQRTVPRVRQVRCILRKCGESDFNARIGVLRLELSGNNQGHDGQTCAIEDRFIMDTIVTELPTAKSYATPGHLGRTSENGFVQNARGENLGIETIPSNPVPADRPEMGYPLQHRWNSNYRSRHEKLREGLVFLILRGPSDGSSRSPVPAGPHLLQRYPSGRSADPHDVSHCVSPKPSRPGCDGRRRGH
jgi:hypothetical protein